MESELKMNLNLKKSIECKVPVTLTTIFLLAIVGCTAEESRVKSDLGVTNFAAANAAESNNSAQLKNGGYSNDGYLPASIPGDMGPETGGGIVIEQVYHQLSIVGLQERIRVKFDQSPDADYTVSSVNVPDGLSINLQSDKKRFYVAGTPTPTALAESPYETEITLSNHSDSRTIRFKWHIRDGAQPDPTTAFRPCGGNPNEGGILWSWAWAGKDQEHIKPDISGTVDITRLEDLSGNNHYYYNETERGGHVSETGYSWRTYYTPYPTIGLNESLRTGRDFGGQDLLQNGSLDASGPFYLVAAVMNTKTGSNGNREIFGNKASGNALKYTQGPENRTSSNVGKLNMWVDGNSETLTEEYSYSTGPMLIEILRDNNDIVRAMVNGVDLTINGGVSMPGNFNMSGLSGENVSGFDDAGFEFIVCKGLPSEAQQSETREYLRAKWNLYSREENSEIGVCK